MHTLKSITVNNVFLFLLLTGGFAATAEGRSVYAITDRVSTVTAYHINGVQIDYQTTDTGLPDHAGAVGLALDRRKTSLHPLFHNFFSKNQNFSQHLPFERRHIYGSATEPCPADLCDLPSYGRPNAVFVRI